MIYDVMQSTQAEGGDIWDDEEKEGAIKELEQLNLKPTPSNMLKAVDSGDRPASCCTSGRGCRSISATTATGPR